MKSQQLKWIILVALALIWGSSFILIKRGLDGLNPYQLGSLRIIFCAVFLLIVGFKSLSSIAQHQWKYIALTSLFGTFIPAYLFAIAETKVSSSICSILNSLTPLNTLILGAIAFGLNFRRNQIFGIIIGLIGTAVLIFNGNEQGVSEDYSYSVFVLIATVCYATNVNLIKRYLSDVKPLSITTGNFLVMLVPAIVILCCTDFTGKMHLAATQHAMFYVMILGIVGTGVANVIFYKLIQISSPIFASSVTYLIPIVACLWGILDNEMLTPLQFLGAFIILIGVYLANKK
ncbi:DMT family transporter [Flavobacterium wongokense]|uniref:DMT family transporter n=1 Tax=Flavobacterium wongokense TaxID=2910674 RepID=UPI001F25F50C|nr:DMT family transporter [Flavobacterium sp. WG47]MCF6131778.1 DMT family transporter [Flavobacterium sp. WG47]